MSKSKSATKREPPCPEGPVARQEILSLHGFALVDTRSEPDAARSTDLFACTAPGKRTCCLLLWWEQDQLAQAEMFFTEAEARACMAHGRRYDLNEFALPSGVLRFM